MASTPQADPKHIERLLEDDRRALQEAKARNARQRVAARRAQRAVREARRTLRRVARG